MVQFFSKVTFCELSVKWGGYSLTVSSFQFCCVASNFMCIIIFYKKYYELSDITHSQPLGPAFYIYINFLCVNII